jgi:hypothetical protein
VTDDPFLFNSGDLTTTLQGRQHQARKAITDWDPDQLLATAEADIAEYLVSKYSVECPVLHRDRIEQLPVSEEVRPARGMFTAEPYPQRMTKIVIAVPFDGEEDVFNLAASTRTYNPPRGQVRPGELRLTWLGAQGSSREPGAVRQHFDNELDKIEQFLGWARGDIDRHNASVQALVSSSVPQRKAALLADRQLEASLGFAVRKRPDAQAFAVPVTRRKLDISRPAAVAGPFQPEPVLPQAQYEQALAVLRNARNALERSPSITARMGEETIRDLLLLFLNAQFEGAAAGEVFNASGKTDILIRAEDRNVFVAECKIWRGPKTIQEALTQLLTYLTWRDTKAALLVFIRNGQPTEIIKKAVKEVEQHPNYKRTLGTSEDGERYDYVLHATGDPNQEIQLAFMPFALLDTGNQK